MLSLLLWLCSVTWKQAWHNFLFRISLTVRGSHLLRCFSISVKKGIRVSLGFHWLCRFLTIKQPFSQYCFFESMSIGNLSISQCLLNDFLRCFSSIVRSFMAWVSCISSNWFPKFYSDCLSWVHSKATCFCVLTLYSVSLQEVPISSCKVKDNHDTIHRPREAK